MPLNEADTRAKLIELALRPRGLSEDLVFREQTACDLLTPTLGQTTELAVLDTALLRASFSGAL